VLIYPNFIILTTIGDQYILYFPGATQLPTNITFYSTFKYKYFINLFCFQTLVIYTAFTTLAFILLNMYFLLCVLGLQIHAYEFSVNKRFFRARNGIVAKVNFKTLGYRIKVHLPSRDAIYCKKKLKL
jgi:hypothetical protein